MTSQQAQNSSAKRTALKISSYKANDWIKYQNIIPQKSMTIALIKYRRLLLNLSMLFIAPFDFPSVMMDQLCQVIGGKWQDAMFTAQHYCTHSNADNMMWQGR